MLTELPGVRPQVLSVGCPAGPPMATAWSSQRQSLGRVWAPLLPSPNPFINELSAQTTYSEPCSHWERLAHMVLF